MHASEVVFLTPLTQAAIDSLSDFNTHVAIGSLRRLRTNLFVIKKHNHVNLSMLSICWFCFSMLDNGIESSHATCQIIKTWRGDKFVMHSDKASWLSIAQVEFKVDDLVALNFEILGNQISKSIEMPSFKLELVICNLLNTFSKETINNASC